MNSWKIATATIALVVVTAVGAGLGTAYLMRPASQPDSGLAVTASPAPTAGTPRLHRSAPTASSAPVARAATTPAVRPAVMRTSDPIVPREPAASPETRPAVAQAPVRPVAASAAADCATGGERALRIAKPGLLGAVLGAGMGAAGGAIANGGKAAGKGAVIGGLAGAALGSAYGAYKTKQECGTILGNGSGFAGDNVATDRDITYASTGRTTTTTEAPFQARDSRDSGGITIYNAR